jgi:hypothetical protein
MVSLQLARPEWLGRAVSLRLALQAQQEPLAFQAWKE